MHLRAIHLKLLFWIIIFVLVTYIFGVWLDNSIYPNKLITAKPGSTKLSLKANRYGDYVAHGYINNLATAFIIDMDSAGVVVPSSLAKLLGNSHVNIDLAGIALTNILASVDTKTRLEAVIVGKSALANFSLSKQESQLTISR